MYSIGKEVKSQVIEIPEEMTMPKEGFALPLADDAIVHACDTCITQPTKNTTLVETPPVASAQKDTTSERSQDIFLHDEYSICMGDLPDDLRKVIDAGESLPKAVKAGIVAMVKTARSVER
jgi:hypothetical protein